MTWMSSEMITHLDKSLADESDRGYERPPSLDWKEFSYMTSLMYQYFRYTVGALSTRSHNSVIWLTVRTFAATESNFA